MRFRIAKIVFCLPLLVSVANVRAQQTPAQTENQQTAATANSAVSVFVYRYKQFVGSALAPSVFCDDGELARIENGRFFVAKLAPGKHTFSSNDKQAGIDIDLKGGQDYYIRVELVPGMMKGHGRLTLVQPEQGAYEVKKLKPLNADKVKDAAHVATVSFESQ